MRKLFQIRQGALMSNVLGDILSRQMVTPEQRQDLHAALDDLLDAANADGEIDGPAFWAFMSELAKGRGIAAQIETAAMALTLEVEIEPNKLGANAGSEQERRAMHEVFVRLQMATIFQVISALGVNDGAILPDWFNDAVVKASLLNRATGTKSLPDFMSAKGAFEEVMPLRALARRSLTAAVYRLAEQGGIPLAAAIRNGLPNAQKDWSQGKTWKDWQRELSKHLGLKSIKGIPAALREQPVRHVVPVDLIKQTALAAQLWRIAYAPNS